MRQQIANLSFDEAETDEAESIGNAIPVDRRALRLKQPRKRAKSFGSGEFFAFFIGVISFLEIQLVGRVFATEICLLCYLLISLPKRARALGSPLPWRFLTLAAIWLFGQVVTDAIRGTDLADYTKGWARIVFTILNFAALYLLMRKSQPGVALPSLLGTGLLARFYLDPDPAAASDPWKWGFAFPIIYLIVATASMAYDRRWHVIALSLLSAGVILNFYFNFRSLALMFRYAMLRPV